MTKEEIEKAASDYANKELKTEFTSKVGNFYGFYSSFNVGFKAAQSKLYSEEEVLKLLDKFREYSYSHGVGKPELKMWFQTSKK